MIVSFGDDDTEELFREESNRRFAQIARVALRKLIAGLRPLVSNLMPHALCRLPRPPITP